MWKQEEQTLKFIYKEFVVNFDMPENFNIEKVHKDTFKLAMFFLLYPFSNLDDYEFTRKSTGNNIGLAFSGGVDSSSVLTLYDDIIIPFYHERSGINSGLLNLPVNRKRIEKFEEISGKKIYIIASDMEKLRVDIAKKRSGHLSDLQYFVSMILMSDILGIKYLSCGSMWDGRKQKTEWNDKSKNSTTDYLAYWNKVSELIHRAGYKFFFPVSGCSEVITNNIVQQGKYKDIAMSCVRSNSLDVGCNNCAKCFRKNLLNGKLILNSTAQRYIEAEKAHNKQFPVVVYANNKFGFNIPQLSEYTQYDMSYLEKYYKPDLEFIPSELREDFIIRLKKNGVEID